MPLSLFRADGPPPDALDRAPLMAGVNGQAPVSFRLVRCKGLGIGVGCKARSFR